MLTVVLLEIRRQIELRKPQNIIVLTHCVLLLHVITYLYVGWRSTGVCHERA